MSAVYNSGRGCNVSNLHDIYIARCRIAEKPHKKMDEDSDTGQDIPEFITRTLKQLINLKTNISVIDDFHNDMKTTKGSVSTDITNFANKVKKFLNTFKVQVRDISNTFTENYDAFIKENEVKSSKTCTLNTNNENTNSDSGDTSEENNESEINADDIVENSDSDVPLTVKLNKERDRKLSNSSIRNTKSKETIKSDDIGTVKLKLELIDKEKTKANNDSDKENTKNVNTKFKEINEKEKTLVTSNNNSDLDSEKETTREESKNMVDTDSDDGASIRKYGNKDIKNKNSKKSKVNIESDSEEETAEKNSKKLKKVTDSDNTRKSKKKDPKNKKTRKSKIDDEAYSDAENTGKIKSNKINKDTVIVSDSNLEKNKSKSKVNKTIDETDSESEKTAVVSTNYVSDDSDTSSKELKAKVAKNKKSKKSKVDNNIDSEKETSNRNRKKHKKVVESDSDTSLSIRKSKNKDTTDKRSKESKDDLDSDEETSDKNKKERKKVVQSDSDTNLSSKKSKNKDTRDKKSEKSKVDSDLDSDEKTSGKNKKDRKKVVESDSDTSLNIRKSKNKDTTDKKSKESKVDSDLDSHEETSCINKNDKKKVVESDSDTSLSIRKSKNKDTTDKKSKEPKVDSDLDTDEETSCINKNDKKKVVESDSDTSLSIRKSKNKDTTDKKSKESKVDSDIDSMEEKSDKNRKERKKVVESDSDTTLSMTRSRNNDKKKKCKKSKKHKESDLEAEETEKSKTHKTRENSVSDSDSNLEKNKTTIEHKNVDETDSDNTKSEKTAAVSRKDDEGDKNKTSTLDNDSDSYTENPKIIIEKSKKALEEKRKSSKQNKKLDDSNDSENVPENLNTITSEKTDKSDKNVESIKTTAVDESLKTNNESDKNKNIEDSDNDDVSDRLNTSTKMFNPFSKNNSTEATNGKKNNNSDMSEEIITNSEKDMNGDVSVKTENIVEKPKFGLIKCIDITKLLDPKIKAVKSSPLKTNTSIIILSSSESETDSKPNKTKSPERKNKQKVGEKFKNSFVSKFKNVNSDKKCLENKKKQREELEIIGSEECSNGQKPINRNKKSESKQIDEKSNKKSLENKKRQDEKIETIDSNDSSNSEKTETKNKKSKNKKIDEKSNKNSLENKKKQEEIETIDSDESSDDGKRRLRFNKRRERLTDLASKSFEKFKKIREKRAAAVKKPIIENSSSSSSDSDSQSLKSIASEKAPRQNTKMPRTKNNFKIDSNYDYKKDIKFKSECYVSLPRIPVEQLKTKYLEDKEESEINRLTNMKTLKRTRQQKDTPSSSDSDVKSVKKRNKLQQKQRKKTSDDEEQSEHSGNNDSRLSDEEPIKLDTGKKDAKLSIPDDLLDSDGDSNKHSDSSDKEDKDTDKKKSKKDKKKDNKKTDKAKESDDEGNDKDNEKKKEDDEKKKEDKEKSKWRNDPLLKGKLSASDSEDELIRFRNKKAKAEDEIRSEQDEEIVVPKKSKTKKHLKRIARRLGSDISSSEDEKEESKKSETEKEQSDNSDENSSDSDEEKSKKKPVRRRIKRIKTSDDSSDGEESKSAKKKKKDEEEQSTRKKIRHVWSKDSLADSTKEAAKEEEERKKRIADRQKLYNEIYENKLDSNAKVDKVILDFNEETKEELLSVHPDLVAKLKPHQAKGVQFMWYSCFESLERAQNTEGSGCILAHCMGLGKTLQVITLIHTLLTNTEKTKVNTVLVVCPLSTVLNWVSEFKKWLDDIHGEQVNVFDLVQHKQNYERLYQMQDWMKFGGVMVMGYDMFRNLSNPKGKRMSKKLINGFNKVLLEPGPDLVVCDEGHLLKNEKTGISIAMNRLKTLRRIVLTGTPLQNNLKEYFCMVQFVKPNLLGTYKEYLNRFVNPITNGQYTDSTPHDIQIMRRRAHVLHKKLDAVVERRDYNVLAPFLPPKHEYVLFVSLTEVQIKLYREYLSKFSRNTNAKGTSYLFQDFQELQRICIHPRVLLDKSNQDRLRRDHEDDDSEGSLKDFINDDESDKSTTANDSTSASESDSEKKPTVGTRRTRSNPGNIEEEDEPVQQQINQGEWWSQFCQGDELDNICHSSKIKLLFDILHSCEMIGDKILVFSQSLYSLNLIEYFLSKVDEATQSGDTESLEKVGGHTGSWAIGLDYFRLDGSTSCDNRATWCKTFNNEANTRARLFLISTRAGGLGINLVAANRVIIFDVSWNPSFDIQSIYRIYRFGQTKPCYIYRFVTMGTMENKIYERQVTKQAISKRVIDEQQIDRHYNQTDLAELYAFNPVPDEERPIPLVPKDRLFADLLQTHDKQIFKYHEHNSLLEDKADEGLNEEERKAAWEEFENEKTAPKFNLMQTMVRNGMFETLRILVQEDNNGWTPAQINNILPAVVQRISEQVTRGDYSMYRRVEERHEMRVMEQRRMQMVYAQYMQQLRTASGGANMTPADMNKLAQMFSAYNQNLAAQQAMQPQPQMPGSSVAASFNQGDPPLQTTLAPTPHPAVSEVVDLID